MPFIVPVYFCLKAAKDMQFSRSIMRINYLKNIYSSRITSYLSVFLFTNLIGL